MRNQDADHPWGIYVPYFKEAVVPKDGSMGIHYSGYDGGLIKGDLDLMLRTRQEFLWILNGINMMVTREILFSGKCEN